jgi:phosphoglycerate-specific signal transduction histidine kinase
MNLTNDINIGDNNGQNNTNDNAIDSVFDIKINELSDNVSNITKSPNKNDFIKKYNEVHNKIKKVDEILYTPSSLDPNIDIKILFEMLKEYDELIGDISVQEYKNMCDLVILIESKLKTLSMDIKEIQ